MTTFSRRAALATGGLGALYATSLAAGTATAQDPRDPPPDDAQPNWALPGAVPLPRRGTARLSVVNHGDAGIIIPCNKLMIVRDTGEVLAEREVERLAPGRGAHLDYEAPPTGREPINIYAVVRHTPGARVGSTLTLTGAGGDPLAMIVPCGMPDPGLDPGS